MNEGDPDLFAAPTTNATAANELPHRNLGREEAAELLTAVFGELVDRPTGALDAVDVQRFNSDYVAVVEPEDSATSHPSGLLTSLLPLRVETDDGKKAPVDLSLQNQDGELQSQNPLTDLGIPSELGEGIELAETGVSIEVMAAPESRAPSNLSNAAAFYPNIAQDSDLVVMPTHTGAETSTVLRSPEAPTTHTYELTLPEGARLEATPEGGASVEKSGELLVSVLPPTAIDAEGDPVEVTMGVSGSKLAVEAHLTEGDRFPIYVDPIFETYFWTQNPAAQSPEWQLAATAYPLVAGWASGGGLGLYAYSGSISGPPYQAMANYYVPRFFSDFNNPSVQERPTSYIRKINLWDLSFIISENKPYANHPYLHMGLWNEKKQNWVSLGVRWGGEGQLTDPNHVYELTNSGESVEAKNGGIALITFESVSRPRMARVGMATVEINDQDFPGFTPIGNPTGWMHEQRTAEITYSASDSGLGIHTLRVLQPKRDGGSELRSTSAQCDGSARQPCPRTVLSTQRPLNFDPKTMPQGENRLNVTAVDPVGHQTTTLAKVKVDHSSPSLALSGDLTEQAKLGTGLAQYKLKYTATDGDSAAPEALASFGSAGTGSGQFERPMGVATDAAGNMFVSDRLNNRVMKFDASGNLLLQFGTTGSANGQFSDNRGIAVSSNGTVWVADWGNKRVQQFSSSGAFLRKVDLGASSNPYAVATGPNEALWVVDQTARKVWRLTENGAVLGVVTGKQSAPDGAATDLLNPVGAAVDQLGNAWVVDQGNEKIRLFSATGKFLYEFGTPGSGQGQLFHPRGVAIAPSGNLLVTDEAHRVQEFKPDGTFVRQFGANGSGAGQLFEPQGLAVGPGNQLAVADGGNKRISRWAHAAYDPQSGAASTEVKIDGSLVEPKYSPGCATKDCKISDREWLLNADNYAVGQHKVEVTATDGVGLSTTKSLTIETHGDRKAPTVAVSGSMTEQGSLGTTRPRYVLKVNATDPGSAEERQSGVASMTVKVDGKVVDATSPGCPTGGCSMSREWILKSNDYAPGIRFVEVIVGDAAGRTTTKLLTLMINRDTTPPQLTAPNNFFTAPEGWVEQKTYAYAPYAFDPNGYGVTSMVLKIDGAVVKNAGQLCLDGGCGINPVSTIDTAPLPGGAHSAELIATDGAGNVAKKTWTVNVDPSGAINSSEATDTMEAVEVTAPVATEMTPVDGLVTEVAGDEGLTPQLVLEEGELHSDGTPTASTVSLNPEDGFSVDTAALSEAGILHTGTIEVEPTQVGPAASDFEITDGSAAVVSNTAAGVDTIIRPAFDGLMQFQAIRHASAPEAYSWNVTLGQGDTLKLVDNQHAAVYWDDGTQALLIAAPAAQGAAGESIATSLSVSNGSVLTLNVHHRMPNIAYPVVAGVGWQGGFRTDKVVMPPPEDPELLMSVKTEQFVSDPPEVYPSESSDPEGATASATPVKYLKKFAARQCEADLFFPPIDGCSIWEQKLKGFFWYNYRKVWQSREPACPHGYGIGVTVQNPGVCAWVGPGWQKYGGGHHITAQVQYDVTYAKVAVTKQRHLSIYAYGSGYWNDHDTDCVCNPLPTN